MTISYKKTWIYTLGLLVISLGANVLLRSELGAGAWDTVSKNLSVFLNITLGTATAIVYTFVLGFITIYKKDYKYLLIIFPILILSLCFDFWDILIFKDLVISNIFLKLTAYLIGGYLLALGLSLTILSKYPPMVFEELTFSLMSILKVKKFFNMRIMIELFAILLATGFGFLAGIRFGAVNFGSFILAIALGPIIAFNLHYLIKLKFFNEIESQKT